MADVNQEILLKLKAIDELTPVMLKALQGMESQSQRMGEALDRVSQSTRETSDSTKGLNSGLLNLAAGWTLIKGAVDLAQGAYAKVAGEVHRSIEEAVAAEKVQNQLTGALISTGNYTQALSDKIENYSKKLSDNKGIASGQTKALIAQAVQMGLNVDRALQMEEAARKLAVATGQDATSAFSLLQSAMNGNVRGLAKVLPEVKNFTSAQLQSGAAIDLVSKKLDAQYQLYQGSFSASVNKAKNSISNVYEAIGNIIIQNPLVLKAISAFTDMMVNLQHGIESVGKWLTENQATIEEWATAIGQVLQVGAVVLGGWAVAAGVAAVATGSLAAVMAILASPITLAIAAAVGLAAAFKAYPDLFDKIMGGLKIMVSTFLEGMAGMTSVAAKVAKAVGMDGLAGSLQSTTNGLTKQSESWGMAGAQQIEYAGTSMATAKIVEEAAKAENAAIDSNLAKLSEKNAKAKLIQQTYGDFRIGTAELRKELEAQASARDADLKKFEEYMNNRMRLAVSKEDEQAQKIAKFRAAQLTSKGPEAKSAGAEAEIAEEENRQVRLQEARRRGVITQNQLDEEMLASRQAIQQQQLQVELSHTAALAEAMGEGPASLAQRRTIKESEFQLDLQQRMEQMAAEGATEAQMYSVRVQRMEQHKQTMRDLETQSRQQELDLALQHQQNLANALGESEAGFAMKQQLAEQRHQFDLQERIRRAQEEGATELEIQSLREQADLEHKARMREATAQHYEQEAQMHQQAGNDWEALLARMRAEQERHGAILGTLRAVQNSEEYQGTMTMLSNLSSLRNSKSRTMFEIGKKAAMAETAVKTGMAAMSAYSSMAGIPFVGPVLGAAAAAAAIAAGAVQLQKISSQKFEGGQADSGMDSVPQNLSGRSFILSGGERVVQPTANKQLTEFLNKEQRDDSGRGNNYNITLNYSGNGSADDARKMAEIVMKEIRSASERGTQVISAKGVY